MRRQPRFTQLPLPFIKLRRQLIRIPRRCALRQRSMHLLPQSIWASVPAGPGRIVADGAIEELGVTVAAGDIAGVGNTVEAGNTAAAGIGNTY